MGVQTVADNRNICQGCWSIQSGDNLMNQKKMEPLGNKGLYGWTCFIPLSSGIANLRSHRKVDSECSFLIECRDILFWTTPASGPGPQPLGLGCFS